MACIKLMQIGHGFAAGYATAKLYKISPTDELAEEGLILSFESFVPGHIHQLYRQIKKVSCHVCVTWGFVMVVKQWLYSEYRIDLHLIGSDYVSHIYEPGSIEKIGYTPVIEMKHGQVKAEQAAEAFVNERMKKKNLANL